MSNTQQNAGPGTINDAEKAALQALVAAGQALKDEPAGDKDVIAAVELGWLIEDIVIGRDIPPLDGEKFDDPTVGYRAQHIRLDRLAQQLALDDLGLAGTSADLDQGGPSQNISSWPGRIEATLLGRDGRLARGYLVGRGLCRLRNSPYSRSLFEGPEIAQLVDRLDQLASALPAHAACGVAAAIRRWCAFDPTAPHKPDKTGQVVQPADILEGQCDHWYRLITGQKRATDALTTANYLDSAMSLLRRTTPTVVEALKPIRGILAGAAVVIVAAFALLLTGGFDLGGTTSGTSLAGVTALIGAFGLTWKTVGATLGRLAGRLEAPLWNAELDNAVAAAITYLPRDADPDVPSYRELRKEAGNGDYALRAVRLQRELGAAPTARRSGPEPDAPEPQAPTPAP